MMWSCQRLRVAGATEIYKVGGAQAVAAMDMVLETIPERSTR